MITPTLTSPAHQLAEQMVKAGLTRAQAHELLDREFIISALEEVGGKIKTAARRIQVHEDTVERRLRELNLSALPKEIKEKNKTKRRQMALRFAPERAVNFYVQKIA